MRLTVRRTPPPLAPSPFSAISAQVSQPPPRPPCRRVASLACLQRRPPARRALQKHRACEMAAESARLATLASARRGLPRPAFSLSFAPRGRHQCQRCCHPCRRHLPSAPTPKQGCGRALLPQSEQCPSPPDYSSLHCGQSAGCPTRKPRRRRVSGYIHVITTYRLLSIKAVAQSLLDTPQMNWIGHNFQICSVQIPVNLLNERLRVFHRLHCLDGPHAFLGLLVAQPRRLALKCILKHELPRAHKLVWVARRLAGILAEPLHLIPPPRRSRVRGIIWPFPDYPQWVQRAIHQHPAHRADRGESPKIPAARRWTGTRA